MHASCGLIVLLIKIMPTIAIRSIPNKKKLKKKFHRFYYE